MMTFGTGDVRVDLASPVSLAIEQGFSERQPRHFGAPPATSRPFAVPGFSGSVAHGASCNCQVLTLTPHCNGTHTECVGHLTREPLDAHRVAPLGFVPAILVTLEPVGAKSSNESTDPAPQRSDQLITRAALEASWSAAAEPAATTASSQSRDESRSLPESLASAPAPRAAAPFRPRALVIRTLPNTSAKQHQDYSDSTPPYLTREAASLLVERGIEHLVVDLPSIDRSHDEGRLTRAPNLLRPSRRLGHVGASNTCPRDCHGARLHPRHRVGRSLFTRATGPRSRRRRRTESPLALPPDHHRLTTQAPRPGTVS